jgi:hypothetical protein
MTDQTIKTVQGFFGEETVTKEEFANQWMAQVVQFWNIATVGADAETIDTMMLEVRRMAEAKWDAMK